MRGMSTSSSHQPRNRTPAGVPSGGQFATERRGEAGLATLAAPTDETPTDDGDDGGRLDLSGTVEERWEAFTEGGRTVKARFTPEEWGDNDYAYPAGPDQEVDVTAILDRRGLGDLDDTSLDNARDALYEAAVEAGYAPDHDGPYSFEIDPDDLEEYTIGRERYGLVGPRSGPVPINPELPRAADHGGVTAAGSKAASARFDDAMWSANMDRITQTRAREVADQISEHCPQASTFILDSDGSEDGYEVVSGVFDADGNELEDVDTAAFDAFPPDEAQQMGHLGQEVISEYDRATGQSTYRPLAEGEHVPPRERYRLTRRYSLDAIRSRPLPQLPQRATPFDPVSQHLAQKVGGPVQYWHPSWDASGQRYSNTVHAVSASGETHQVEITSAEASQALGWHERMALESGDGAQS